jgi:hypothetical protein
VGETSQVLVDLFVVYIIEMVSANVNRTRKGSRHDMGRRSNVRIIEGMLRGLQAEALNAKRAAATAQRRAIAAISLAKTRMEEKAAGATRRAKAHAKAAKKYATTLAAAKGSRRSA